MNKESRCKTWCRSLLTKVEVLTEGYTKIGPSCIISPLNPQRCPWCGMNIENTSITKIEAADKSGQLAQGHTTDDHSSFCSFFAGCQTIIIMILTKMLRRDLLLPDYPAIFLSPFSSFSYNPFIFLFSLMTIC